MHPGQRTVFAKRLYCLFIHGHYNATVGIRVVSFGRRPSVYYKFIGISGSRRNNTPGAHTEGENAVAIHLFDEAVRCRWKVRATAWTMILYGVDQRLWMFHAYAQGKGLSLNMYIFRLKEYENIPCRMTCCQHDGGCFDG